MKKFYIAFSVHSTKAYAIATLETKDFVISRDGQTITINGRDYTVAKSRRPDYNEETDGTKLQTQELMTREGKPLRSTPMIAAFFNRLEREGWTVDKTAFVQKHWHKNEATAT